MEKNMVDIAKINDILMNKIKVRGNPVAISFIKDKPFEGYEPIQDCPCSIIRYAMDEGKRVYFDEKHNDCLVGVHHAGIVPGKKEIASGYYLSASSNFFTEEAAMRNKMQSYCLPQGLVKGIAAAPLSKVPEGVKIEWVVVVCNPFQANNVAGSITCRDGALPYGELGASLCASLFATPWFERNIVYTPGDFGGRMHNRIKKEEMFVIVPYNMLHYIEELMEDMRIDVKKSREMTKPDHSEFWKEGDKKEIETADSSLDEEKSQSGDVFEGINFTMEWDDEAKEMMKEVPEGILEMAVGNAEEFAREKGYEKVSKKSIQELMKKLGMEF
ncbi:MAG: hypothetical protein D6734_12870 [Candidatus Schekmanbacteria bacterium]|nr:MAG: hypothetical protein D6734_12870 [Candidatus Schekmanbacteria bacterium]